MFRSKSKRLTRKLLTISFFLLAVVALLISPGERQAHALEACHYCVPNYQYCLEGCPAHDDLCRSRCEFEYYACVGTCEP